MRYRLFDSINGIGRGNRLANAAGPDHLDQFAQYWRDFGKNVRVALKEALDGQLVKDQEAARQFHRLAGHAAVGHELAFWAEEAQQPPGRSAPDDVERKPNVQTLKSRLNRSDLLVVDHDDLTPAL